MAKFSVSNPGAKEYLIVGGVAIGVFALYKWWQSRNAASAAAANPAGTGTTSAPSTPTGLSTGDLMAWIHDHTSTTTTTTGGSTTTGSGGSGSPTPTPGTTSGSPGNKEITLKKGRSLASLAAEYGVTVGTLRGLNPHLGARVPAGTKVRVPGSVAAARRG